MSADYFRHQWETRCEIETAWETDVVPSGSTLAESRRQVRSRPLRSIRFLVQALDRGLSSRLLGTLIRLAHQDWGCPLYPDVAVVSASSSGTTLNVPTANRRFYATFQVVVLPWDGGTYGEPQVRTIQTVNASSLNLTSALTGTVPIGSLAFPLLSARQKLNESLSFVNDALPQLAGVADERVGSTLSLPESHDDGAVASFQTSGGVPILDVFPNWTTSPVLAYVRDGDETRLGKETLTLARPAKGRWRLDMLLQVEDRASYWRILQFFDSRRGRLQSFWVPAPMGAWTVQAISTTFVDVDAEFDPADVLLGITNVCVVQTDGTVLIRGISGIASPGAGTQRISFSSSIPALTLAEIRWVGIAFLGRFVSDALKEEWINSDKCQMQVSMIEVLDEGDHDLEQTPDEEFVCEELMLIERREDVPENTVVPDLSNTIPPPQDAVDGDLLILFLGRSGSAPSLPTGWTSILSWSTTKDNNGLVCWKEYDAAGDPSEYDIGLFSGDAFMVGLAGADVVDPVFAAVLEDEVASNADVPLPAAASTLGAWVLRFATSNIADDTPDDNGGLTHLGSHLSSQFSMHLWEDANLPAGIGTVPEVLVTILDFPDVARGATVVIRPESP